MSEYRISQIATGSVYAKKELLRLLSNEGISLDPHVEYTVGAYDEDGALAATGSLFHNTLRCLAVSGEHRGEGLMNSIVSALTEYAASKGITHLFLYTKPEYEMIFTDLGFQKLVLVPGKLLFMENERGGFARFQAALREQAEAAVRVSPEHAALPDAFGAIVMNANPFTNGHRYLVEEAYAACKRQNMGLLLFVVSEDSSIVPADVRFCLVKEGCADLTDVIILHSGGYIISSATFPSYFLKGEEDVIRTQAHLDIEVFSQIAACLNIRARFAGTEPYSATTAIYNDVMREHLPAHGIAFYEIPRLCSPCTGSAVSASLVRCLLHEQGPEAIRPYVPESTYRYFASAEAEKLCQQIQKCELQALKHE